HRCRPDGGECGFRRCRGRDPLEPRQTGGAAAAAIMNEPTDPRAEPPAGSAPGPTLLIVDDDAPLRTRLATAMERRGYQVTTAESVAAGIAAARSTRPLYAVCDLKLGDGNGLEVVQA